MTVMGRITRITSVIVLRILTAIWINLALYKSSDYSAYLRSNGVDIAGADGSWGVLLPRVRERPALKDGREQGGERPGCYICLCYMQSNPETTMSRREDPPVKQQDRSKLL